MALHLLEGQISDEEFNAKADLETRVVLQRHLLERLSDGTEPLLQDWRPTANPRSLVWF